MKKYIFEPMKQTLLLLCLINFTISFGQNSFTQTDSFKTKLEKEVNAKNVLIKKEYIELERIKKVDFKFIRVYNFETKVTTKGLYIAHKSGRYKKMHYLDSAEIMAFYKYLLSMDTAKYNFNSNDAVNYNIRSKDNFNIVMKYNVDD